MAVTQTISNFPDAPNSSTDTPQEFNTKADAFVNHQSGIYTPEVNTWADQVNTTATEVNTDATTATDMASEATTQADRAEANAGTTFPNPVFPTAEGYVLTAREAEGNVWEEAQGGTGSGLPDENGQSFKTITNNGVTGNSFWSPFVTSPNVVSEDFTLASGASASIVSPTIEDGVTVEIPDSSILVIL